MPIPTEMSNSHARVIPRTSAAAATQPHVPSAAPAPRPPVDGEGISPERPYVALRKQIPKMLLEYEPKPLKALCSNPVLNERSAAALVGVSQDLMKKWRQRGFGPNYIQYGENGPVRYELLELTEFREIHRVQASSKK